MTTAEQIKSARSTLGMTQTELADALGVSWETVASWEQGKRSPGGPALKLIEQMVANKRPKK